jgi:hypothetical protein
MSNTVRAYLAVVAVIVAAVVPASLLSALAPAGASTTACGSSCTSPSVKSLGTGEVLAVSGSGVAMSAASTTNTAEDWTPEEEGDVYNAVSAGVLSQKLQMLYGTDPVMEYQYAPGGVPSGKCLGAYTVNSTDSTTTTVPVTLIQCGVNTGTLWIVDQDNEANGYVDLISGGDIGACLPSSVYCSQTVPFAEPGVLTVTSSGSLEVAQLSELGGVVSSTQLWAAWSSPAQAALRAKVALRAKAAKSR